MREAEGQRHRDMPEDLPSRAAQRWRQPPTDPGDPEEQHQREPARNLPDDGRGETVFRLLVQTRLDVEYVDDADHDCCREEGVEESLPKPAARPQSVAAHPKPLPDITDRPRLIPSRFS